ncbi:imidazolonepropionase [Acidithiobacillus thiooxidans]|uniref:imidazolonepropionase n=1 Tax=Acidithiobacillus thiooxidans TaxID=930 RepID=UPI00285EE4A4|nr:imidazolonepropionase [Acidithiobacillus thiooxidans]MDR7925785.1 imidazolonepropionase [Acidithiobacillus thiooxidans]
MSKLFRHATVVTLSTQEGWSIISDGAIWVNDDHIQWVGKDSSIPLSAAYDSEEDLEGAVVTPGLIDCHTHLIYGGDRTEEFEERLKGVSYAEIAHGGGGILSTVRATRASSSEVLLESAKKRLLSLMQEGITTIEIKSGYGLSLDSEATCLRVARQLAIELPVSVRTTCLAAHTIAPEFSGEGGGDSYVEAVCHWLPLLDAEGLLDAVDGFCEEIAFNRQQIRRIFSTAQRLGIPVKLHAEQLSNQHGAELAAEFGALSCDHLEYLDTAGIKAIAKSGTVAVLLPSAFYAIREKQCPPVSDLRAAGVPIALATDHNPGTSPCLSPLLIMNMACILFRMTPEEALRGMTVNAARALGLSDRGKIVTGSRADLAIWPLDHPRELAYGIGQHPQCRLIVGGKEVSL